jgi:hypothetical protein
VRIAIHFALCGLLGIVSITAPFAHAHQAGKAKEHLAKEHFRVLHAHLPLPSRDRALNEADQSARRMNWFHFEVQQPVALAPPAEHETLGAPPSGTPDRLKREDSEPAPEESPPRAVVPRGPPILFA